MKFGKVFFHFSFSLIRQSKGFFKYFTDVLLALCQLVKLFQSLFNILFSFWYIYIVYSYSYIVYIYIYIVYSN